MRRILIKAWFLLAILSFSVSSFSQQGGQIDSTKKSNPANTRMQNQQVQNTQVNPANQGSQSSKAGQNDNSLLQPMESYPLDQNLEINKKNLLNPLTNKLVYPDEQNSESNQGMQAPATGTKNNPGVTEENQNRDNIQKNKEEQTGKEP